MKLKDIKLNPSNPRVIKDNKFKQLVQSIQNFPEMLSLRPIVVNEDMVVLGGNMRLRACQEAKLKEVPVIIANELTSEQQREFIIKDNVVYRTERVSWYSGGSLLDEIQGWREKPNTSGHSRMGVQLISRAENFRGLSGTVSQGEFVLS